MRTLCTPRAASEGLGAPVGAQPCRLGSSPSPWAAMPKQRLRRHFSSYRISPHPVHPSIPPATSRSVILCSYCLRECESWVTTIPGTTGSRSHCAICVWIHVHCPRVRCDVEHEKIKEEEANRRQRHSSDLRIQWPLPSRKGRHGRTRISRSCQCVQPFGPSASV